MDLTETHVMTTELFAERRTMRYSCPLCQRCMEDGPEGLRIIQKGDPTARHVGGVLAASLRREIEQAVPEKRILH